MIDSLTRAMLLKYDPENELLKEVDDTLIQKAVDVLNVLAQETKTPIQKLRVQSYAATLLKDSDSGMSAVQKSAFNETDTQIAEFFDEIGMVDIAKAVRARIKQRGNE